MARRLRRVGCHEHRGRGDPRGDGSATRRTATSAYIARIDEDAEREERRKRIERAQEHMAEIGKRMQPGPDGVTVIRQVRDALPEWLTDRERTDDE